MKESCAAPVLLVDDEPLARDVLRRYVAGHAELTLAEEAASGREALDLLRRRHEDRSDGHDCELLLLDIQMPEVSGLELLARLEQEGIPLPSVIFVTAYDRYAVRAFEWGAVDYLVKPVTPQRFDVAIERWLARREPLRRSQLRQVLQDALQASPERILVRQAGKLVPVDVDTISWIEAAGDYVRLHCAQSESQPGASRKATYLVEKPLRELAELLAPRGFVQIHRSALVNRKHIARFHSIGSGRYAVKLDGGTELVASRTYASRLRETSS